MPVNEADLDWQEYDRDESAFRRKELGAAADGDQLGCSLYELDPGDRSWPYHYHTANEEAIYVLAGTGTLRGESGETELQAGDFAALLAEESGGHQVVNDGDETLRYLMVSTMNEPDVTVYPEMEKFGVYVGSPPGGREERTFEGYFPLDADVDYWE
jgi:uncharacterized cupin superfamily protein